MKPDRPSLTAIKIARGIVFVAEDPRVRDVLPRGAVAANESLLERAGLLKASTAALYKKNWFRRFAHWVASKTAPGQMMTLPVRKRFMDDEVRRALDDGASQLLVVGAGFDSLAFRIAGRFRDVQCFELDHPATQSVKRGALDPVPNLHYVAADLASKSVAEALEFSGWRSDTRSVVVAEGLLMYLEEAEVIHFFQGVRAATARGTTLAFTHIGVDDDGAPAAGTRSRAMRVALKLAGEPLKWGIRREALPGFLDAHGYTLLRAPTPEALRESYLVPAGLGDEIVGDIELMASAEVV